MGGFPIYGQAKLNVFLYIYMEKALIQGKIGRFSIFEIYFIDFLPNGKKIWNNTEKIQRILKFGSNFKALLRIQVIEGNMYFLGRGLGVPSDFLHSLSLGNLGYNQQVPQAAKLQKYFSGFHRCPKWANWRILG